MRPRGARACGRADRRCCEETVVSEKPLSDLRKDYERGEFDETMAAEAPLEQFRQWLNEAIAAKVPEPNAMTLATVGPQGRPSTRVVLIKGFDERGLVWYTNYQSRKGRELAANPQAALQFHWVEMERVVRIEGQVEFSDAAEADAYYASRPLASRIGAWASEQSEILPSRMDLVRRTAEMGLAINPSRSALTTGMPPATAASNLRATPRSSASGASDAP